MGGTLDARRDELVYLHYILLCVRSEDPAVISKFWQNSELPVIALQQSDRTGPDLIPQIGVMVTCFANQGSRNSYLLCDMTGGSSDRRPERPWQNMLYSLPTSFGSALGDPPQWRQLSAVRGAFPRACSKPLQSSSGRLGGSFFTATDLAHVLPTLIGALPDRFLRVFRPPPRSSCAQSRKIP